MLSLLISSIFQQYSQPLGLSPHCICLRSSFFCTVLCIALGFVLMASRSILCGNGWWQLVVIPLPNHMVALYHLAPQKLALFVSSICFLWRRWRPCSRLLVSVLSQNVYMDWYEKRPKTKPWGKAFPHVKGGSASFAAAPCKLSFFKWVRGALLL